jgi:hypothetical protein
VIVHDDEWCSIHNEDTERIIDDYAQAFFDEEFLRQKVSVEYFLEAGIKVFCPSLLSTCSIIYQPAELGKVCTFLEITVTIFNPCPRNAIYRSPSVTSNNLALCVSTVHTFASNVLTLQIRDGGCCFHIASDYFDSPQLSVLLKRPLELDLESGGWDRRQWLSSVRSLNIDSDDQ